VNEQSWNPPGITGENTEISVNISITRPRLEMCISGIQSLKLYSVVVAAVVAYASKYSLWPFVPCLFSASSTTIFVSLDLNSLKNCGSQ
jgi:hypothetical protein